MPWRKLLQITSKFHALAVAYYICNMALGLVLTISGQPPILYVMESSGEQAARLWALLLLAGGVLGIVSMFFKDIEEYLILEGVGVALIAGMMVWILLAMSVTTKQTPFGVILVSFFALGGIARLIQVIYELIKVRRAKRNPISATAAEYLAAPTDN